MSGSANTRFLFRGVNQDLHLAGGGLRPKQVGAFVYAPRYGDPDAKYGSGWTYGENSANAVRRHQDQQRGHPTSGVSTTPVYERAVYYATRNVSGHKCHRGYVYKIDRDLLAAHGVDEYVVRLLVADASVPEDDEVVLVATNGEALPEAIVVEVSEVAV
jgi:hypothetical protein